MALEKVVGVDLLAMRTASTKGIAFVLLTLFRVSSGIADRSSPGDIM